MNDDYSPSTDLEEALARRHTDTNAYRLGSQIHDHDTRLKLVERDVSVLSECMKSMKIRFDIHEKEQTNASVRLLLAVIGVVVSGIGAMVVMVLNLITQGHT